MACGHLPAGTVWLNRGGAIGDANMFQSVNVAMPADPWDPANNPARAMYAFAMDVDEMARTS